MYVCRVGKVDILWKRKKSNKILCKNLCPCVPSSGYTRLLCLYSNQQAVSSPGGREVYYINKDPGDQGSEQWKLLFEEFKFASNSALLTECNRLLSQFSIKVIIFLSNTTHLGNTSHVWLHRNCSRSVDELSTGSSEVLERWNQFDTLVPVAHTRHTEVAWDNKRWLRAIL